MGSLVSQMPWDVMRCNYGVVSVVSMFLILGSWCGRRQKCEMAWADYSFQRGSWRSLAKRHCLQRLFAHGQGRGRTSLTLWPSMMQVFVVFGIQDLKGIDIDLALEKHELSVFSTTILPILLTYLEGQVFFSDFPEKRCDKTTGRHISR